MEFNKNVQKKLFVAFLGIYQFRRVGLRFVCWFYDGNTQRLTESGFIEKLGIEPALIHYTTANVQRDITFLWPCSLAVAALAGWVYAFCGSMSRNSRKAQPAVVLVLKRLRRWGNGLESHPTD